MRAVLHHHPRDWSILHRHVVHLLVVQLWIPRKVSVVHGEHVDRHG